jgi:hypothetical protein
MRRNKRKFFKKSLYSKEDGSLLDEDEMRMMIATMIHKMYSLWILKMMKRIMKKKVR